jgi:hypothetical protein
VREDDVEQSDRVEQQPEVVVQVRIAVSGHVRVQVPVRDQEGCLIRGREIDTEAEPRVLEPTDDEQRNGLEAEDRDRAVTGQAYEASPWNV